MGWKRFGFKDWSVCALNSTSKLHKTLSEGVIYSDWNNVYLDLFYNWNWKKKQLETLAKKNLRKYKYFQIFKVKMGVMYEQIGVHRREMQIKKGSNGNLRSKMTKFTGGNDNRLNSRQDQWTWR